MKIVEAVISGTKVDKHNDIISLSALKSMKKQIEEKYIPVGIEHDPRIPPIGRIVSAKIEKESDGEYVLIGKMEIFEKEDNNVIDNNDKRTLLVKEYDPESLQLNYDRNYNNEVDLKIINEINNLLKSKSDPLYEEKKSLDPISILKIAGVFVLGGITSGFLNKIGSDVIDLVKEKIKKLFNKKKQGENENLLIFEFCILHNDIPIAVELIISNPDDKDIDEIFNNVIQTLDKSIICFLSLDKDLRRIVFEYSDNKIYIKFGVRKDCVPLFLDIQNNEK